MTRRLLDAFAQHLPDEPQASAPHVDALAALTDREQQVFAAIAQGLSNAEIAASLVLSEATVKTHISRILAKLDLRDRVQVVILAYQLGVARP